MRRVRLVGFVAAGLLLFAARAEGQPTDTPAAESPVTDDQQSKTAESLELQLPESVTRALYRIAAKPAEPVDVQLPQNVVQSLSDIAAELKKPDPPKYSFEEKWLWLGAFALVALGAIGFGWRNSRHAVYLDHQTDDAREKREAIRLGESGAQELFDKLVSTTQTKIKEQNKEWLRFTSWPLTVIGSAVLLAIALLPDIPGGEGWSRSRDATWLVLDSNFSTAFAGVWIALLYFWGATQQRKVASRDSFRMVADEAELIAKMRADKATSELYDDYLEAYDAVGDLSFDPPWFRPSGHDDVEAINAFEFIVSRAAPLAQGTKLSKSDKGIAAENRRLRKLLPRGIFARAPDFPAFLKTLRSDKLLRQHDAAWTALVVAIEARDATLIKAAVRSLGEEMKSDTAQRG